MSNEILGLVLLGALITCIFIGFPISFTLIILSFIFGTIGFGAELVSFLMFFQTWQIMKEVTLAAVPLFIFMGHVLEQAGLMERLFLSFQFILARVKGSLFLGVLFVSTIFATATGIIGASVTVMGLLAAPAMMRSRYDAALSAGVITAGGCLGILIPPSVLLVVLGPVVGVSVVQLFASALIPGLLLSGLYFGYTFIRCQINPTLGPPLPPEQRPESVWVIIREFFLGIVPLAVVVFAALGSIIAGLATPTEAAAMAAVGALVLAALYGRLNWSMLREATLSTLATSSLVLFLAVASNCYGAVFARLGTATLITETMLALPVSPMVMVIILMGVIFLLGWPLEWPAIVLIFVPIFLPVVVELQSSPDTAILPGVEPQLAMVWFCTLVAVNLQTAFLSPPVAMAAYYLKGVAPDWELYDIYKGMYQFMILQVIGLLAVMFYPEIALWLPRLLFGN
ncbi:MAG: C4-dicarboxylate ABC transporter permease [Candidatus Entotheonella factor]|uniref:C4-dicarboxylate ABC transporter permease n=1 Tax=Entotheonella factor TaxID=1429438 RepID=W4LL75_ENTF1|nr:TRAP transporter large permease subunit [Candidatus Entotheonella palauensis]ETW98732.1 MAG: C4-dicarboxylate ABC transporter permease [Candidatus Entotheonella factor]